MTRLLPILSCLDACLAQIGFHLFEYARHFLTCCKRILGLNEGDSNNRGQPLVLDQKLMNNPRGRGCRTTFPLLGGSGLFFVFLGCSGEPQAAPAFFRRLRDASLESTRPVVATSFHPTFCGPPTQTASRVLFLRWPHLAWKVG